MWEHSGEMGTEVEMESGMGVRLAKELAREASAGRD